MLEISSCVLQIFYSIRIISNVAPKTWSLLFKRDLYPIPIIQRSSSSFGLDKIWEPCEDLVSIKLTPTKLGNSLLSCLAVELSAISASCALDLTFFKGLPTMPFSGMSIGKELADRGWITSVPVSGSSGGFWATDLVSFDPGSFRDTALRGSAECWRLSCFH